MASEKPLTPAQRGKLGADKRWGPPRRFRTPDLTPDQRQRVNDLIEASRKENAEKAGER